jgi:transposase
MFNDYSLFMTYPFSFRRKVLSVRKKERLTISEVAARFCVGTASVTRWIKNPDPQLKRQKPATKINMASLAKDVRDNPDAYQYERAQKFNVSRQAIFYALRRLGVSYKKKPETSKGGRRQTAYFSSENKQI